MSWLEGGTCFQRASWDEEVSQVEEGGVESMREEQKLHKGEMKQWEALRFIER